MSREIIVRGWHTGLNKMFSPEEMGQDQLTIMPDGRGFINVSSDSVDRSQFITQMIPMQYTGIRDKNGKRIFDDDICTGMMDFGFGAIENKFVIHFHDDVGYQWNYWYLSTIEVIGNIHEHPHLAPPKTPATAA